MPVAPDSPLRQQAAALLQVHPCRGVAAGDLAEVLAAATLQRLGDGEALCTEGEPGDLMYFLIDGEVRVQRRDANGKMRELAVMRAPNLVGHMSLVDNSPRSASCIAKGRTVVAALDRRTYNQVLTEPSARGMALRRLLLSSLTRQLGDANERIRELLGEASPQAPRRPPRPEDVKPFDDVSDTDLMKVAGVLEGWKADHRGLDQMQVVYDEDQRRNPKNSRVK